MGGVVPGAGQLPVARSAHVLLQLLLTRTRRVADLAPENTLKRNLDGIIAPHRRHRRRQRVAAELHVPDRAPLATHANFEPFLKLVFAVSERATLAVGAAFAGNHVLAKLVLIGAVDVGGGAWLPLAPVVPQK